MRKVKNKKSNSLRNEVLGLLGIVVVMSLFSNIGSAAVGDNIGSVTFSVDCGTGVGIAYDGSNLWYSCFQSGINLFRANPTTGLVTASFSIPGSGLGALAYNASGNSIWAGVSGGDIYLIQLNATKDVVSSTLVFNTNPHLSWGILDGLAYDGKDNTLYLSPDGSKIIHHYTVDGTHLLDGPNGNGDFLWAGNATYQASYYNSGLALGGDLLYEGSNGGSHVWVSNKTDPLVELFNFSTIIAGDQNFRDEDLECDTNTFAPIDVMWSKEAYSPMRAHAFEIPKGTCGVGGQSSGPSFTAAKDFRYTDVNFTAIPAELGGLLPHTDSNYTVKYVIKKDGTVASTNPGQLYGVITINGTGVSNVTVNDTFGTQFNVNPAKLGGGVEVLRVNTTTGVTTILTNTPQIIFAYVDNTLNKVDLAIDLDTPLTPDEKIMVYIKFMISLKGLPPDYSDFVNNAGVIINNGSPITTAATIKFV